MSASSSSSSSEKHFIRNACLAAGLFVAFLLIAPIKYYEGPDTQNTIQDLNSGSPRSLNGQDPDTTSPTPHEAESSFDPTNSSDSSDMPQKYLNIPLTIGGNVFDFYVLRSKENTVELATKFCEENAADLGLTDDVSSKCVEPISSSLSEKFDLAISQLVHVKLEVDGRNVDFEIDTSSPTSIDEQASSFCSEFGSLFGVTEDTLPDCKVKIAAALAEKLNAAKKQSEANTFQVDLDIQGSKVRFNVDGNQKIFGRQESEEFCQEFGHQFGVTSETFLQCVQNIQQALEEKVVSFLQAENNNESADSILAQGHQSASLQKVELDIQGRAVTFNVESNYESIRQQADKFCSMYGADFGVTQDSLPECQRNIQRALEEKVVEQLSQEN